MVLRRSPARRLSYLFEPPVVFCRTDAVNKMARVKRGPTPCSTERTPRRNLPRHLTGRLPIATARCAGSTRDRFAFSVLDRRAREGVKYQPRDPKGVVISDDHPEGRSFVLLPRVYEEQRAATGASLGLEMRPPRGRHSIAVLPCVRQRAPTARRGCGRAATPYPIVNGPAPNNFWLGRNDLERPVPRFTTGFFRASPVVRTRPTRR